MPTCRRLLAFAPLAVALLASAPALAQEEVKTKFETLEEALQAPEHAERLYLGGGGAQRLKSVPATLGKLKRLERLLIYLDAEVLPEVVTGLPILRELSVNGRIRTLPASFGRMKTLTQAHFSNTGLQALPADLSGLQQLQDLNVADAQLKELPDSLRTLPRLETLSIEGSLLPALPPVVSAIPNLRYLWAGRHPWKSLPASIGDAKNLVALDLTACELASLPESITKLSQLETLRLQSNRFTTWPALVGKLPALTELDLHWNEITALPEQLGMPRLEKLLLGANRLATVPASIKTLGALRQLELWMNGLERLPAEVGQLASLKTALLQDNRLERLPPLGGLKALEGLDVRSNRLVELPGDLGTLSRLRALHVSSNRLTALPASLGRLGKLEVLDAGFNDLAALPALDGLKSLRMLALEVNRLTSVPDSIGRLGKLRDLFLNGNALTRIPASVGQLRELERLDLSDNQLTELPAEITKLSSLRILRLSDNKLTDLPAGLSRLTSLHTIHIDGNPLPPKVIARLRKELPDVAVIHGNFRGAQRQRDWMVQALDHLNEVRAAARTARATWDPRAAVGAEAHARYLVANRGAASTKGLSAHREDEEMPLYSKEGAHLEWWDSTMSEVISYSGDPIVAADKLLATYYHRDALVSNACDRVGIGHVGVEDGDGLSVWRFATSDFTSQVSTNYLNSRIAAFPQDGATGVAPRFHDEVPSPVPPEAPGGVAGTMVTVTPPTWLGEPEEVTATFRGSDGHVVDAWALTSRSMKAWNMWPGPLGLLAKEVLHSGVTYRLQLHVVCDRGRVWDHTTSFTTAPAE